MSAVRVFPYKGCHHCKRREASWVYFRLDVSMKHSSLSGEPASKSFHYLQMAYFLKRIQDFCWRKPTFLRRQSDLSICHGQLWEFLTGPANTDCAPEKQDFGLEEAWWEWGGRYRFDQSDKGSCLTSLRLEFLLSRG